MAGEVDASFLPLEGLGNQAAKAKVYGVTGQSAVLPMLQGGGEVYDHFSAALGVPMQTLTFTQQVGLEFSGATSVPMQTLDGHFGMHSALGVPMQVATATGTVPVMLRAALTVPLQVVAGEFTAGIVASAGLSVPMQALAAYGGWRYGGRVPVQVVVGHVQVAESSRLAATVPLQLVTGTITVTSLPWSVGLTVPMIVAGPYGRAALAVPMARVAGTFAIPAEFEAWVMNTRNLASTRFTNYPFVQFTRVRNRTYAVGYDGNLYLLGGDTDNEDPISWTFETGLDDLGSPGVKHTPYLYIDGIIDGEIEIFLKDDRGREFAYEYDTGQRGAVHQKHKRKLGNGIRTTNVAFGMRSTRGAYIEIDGLEPEFTVTQRSV